MINNEVIIYEEDEMGVMKNSSLDNFMQVEGVWALYGKERDTHEERCINVGKTMNVGGEILYDLGCLHFLKVKEDGTKKYINQFNKDCDFFYKSGHTREYLYPVIASRYNSLKFIYIYDKSDEDVEKEYAKQHRAVYWRNGGPFGDKGIDLESERMLMVGELFLDGGEIYTYDQLLEKIEERLGYKKSYCKRLINEWLELGFLTQMNEEIYTR